MRRFLIILNLVLSALAVYLTLYLLRPSTRSRGAETTADSQGLVANKGGVHPSTDSSNAVMSRRYSDVLWMRNLFHPDRSFDENVDEVNISTPDEVNEHFELISIAQVAKRSCASIRVISDKKRQRNRPTRAQRRGAASQKSNSKNKDQKIYMLNDPVGETGFMLAEIGIGSVVLKRNEQEITLHLDKSDDASEKRREVGLKVAAIAAEKTAAETTAKVAESKAADSTAKKGVTAKKTEATPHPPPPPPPPPTVTKPSGQSNATSASSRKKILQEEYLKKVAEQQSKEGNSNRK